MAHSAFRLLKTLKTTACAFPPRISGAFCQTATATSAGAVRVTLGIAGRFLTFKLQARALRSAV